MCLVYITQVISLANEIIICNVSSSSPYPEICVERNRPLEPSSPNMLDLRFKMGSRYSTPEGLWLHEPINCY